MKNKVIPLIIALFVILLLNVGFSILGVRNSFLLGLAGAITPCTIVLIPIFLYRFGIWGKEKLLIKEILLTLFGFLITFSVIGFAFETVSRSFLFDSVKILLIIGMSILSVLQFAHKLNFDFLSKASNSFVLGLLLPLALSLSSCVLPFFSVNLVFAAEKGSANVILNTVAFGLGLIIPAILVGVFGASLYSVLKKSTRISYIIDYIGGFIILGSALYITTRIERLDPINIIIVFIILLIYLGYVVYRVKKSNFFTPQTFKTLTASITAISLGILGLVLYLSMNFITSSKHLISCRYEEIICYECTTAAILLSVLAIILTIFLLVGTKQITLKKIKIKLP